jgi:3'-phosphoadenosine 5'-phosphosulfate (PAPS) 3'-phosphatase
MLHNSYRIGSIIGYYHPSQVNDQLRSNIVKEIHMELQLLAEFLDQIRQIAQFAGKAILQIAAEDIGVTEKSDGSPLTRADMASHLAIQSGLEKLEPRFSVLSEKGDILSLVDHKNQKHVILVV